MVKVLFKKEGSSQFGLNSFNSKPATLAEGKSSYRAIFKDVSYEGVERR